MFVVIPNDRTERCHRAPQICPLLTLSMLLWARLRSDGDPLETFVSIGRTLLEGMTQALSEILEGEASFSGAALVEEPELAMLVKTHAPSDTALVFSMKMQIDVRDEVLMGVSHMMIEPKYLAQLLTALLAAIH